MLRCTLADNWLRNVRVSGKFPISAISNAATHVVAPRASCHPESLEDMTWNQHLLPRQTLWCFHEVKRYVSESYGGLGLTMITKEPGHSSNE